MAGKKLKNKEADKTAAEAGGKGAGKEESGGNGFPGEK